MKKYLSLFLVCASMLMVAQPKKAPKMAPVFTPGYYVNGKGDTVRGQVQVNPDDATDFYKKFGFKAGNAAKPAFIDPKKAKAYGFDGRHFIFVNYDGEDIYLERLAQGRVNFFEYKFNGSVNGYDAVESNYYVQDTRGEGKYMSLREIKKISNRFYKKDLENYLRDQPMVWNDLDKYTFNKEKVVSAINEFNKFYVVAPPAEEE